MPVVPSGGGRSGSGRDSRGDDTAHRPRERSHCPNASAPPALRRSPSASRLVATDLDGTLLRDDGTIDARTRAALTAVQDAGIEIVVCTARPARWITGLVHEAGIAGPAVCANGAVLYDVAAQALLEAFPIPTETALEVVDRLRMAVPDGAWAVECSDRFAHESSYHPRCRSGTTP